MINKAKKIIRSQYKLISDKSNDQMQKQNADSSQSERKDQSSRSAFSAMAAENASTNESDQTTHFGMKHNDNAAKEEGKKIVNYYNGEVEACFSKGITISIYI